MTERFTHWLPALHQGDEQVANRLWQEYFMKIVRLAKRHMSGVRLRAADEEDVALSAMNSFCQMARNRDEPIADSAELWKLLATIVKRKVIKERKRQGTAKRQEHRLAGESGVSPMRSGQEKDACIGLARIHGHEPSPELAVELAETWERIMSLPDAEEIVPLKSVGYTTSEIAEKLGCSTRTIQRRIEKIETEWDIWQSKAEEEWKKE
ncbi:MAG: ECF-type sigma factor [Planctomycetaceae bacterium]|nr:ECF-type sigma factor [Planctomycetaceae bacterium]